MTQRDEEKIKERIVKGLGSRVADGKWRFRGTKFECDSYWGKGEFFTGVHFTATFHYVTAHIEGECRGLPNLDGKFTGDDALSDAIIWAADNLFEMYQIIEKRMAPYRKGQEDYAKALAGLI